MANSFRDPSVYQGPPPRQPLHSHLCTPLLPLSEDLFTFGDVAHQVFGPWPSVHEKTTFFIYQKNMVYPSTHCAYQSLLKHIKWSCTFWSSVECRTTWCCFLSLLLNNTLTHYTAGKSPHDDWLLHYCFMVHVSFGLVLNKPALLYTDIFVSPLPYIV